MNTRTYCAALIVVIGGLEAKAVPILGPSGHFYEYITVPWSGQTRAMKLKR